MAQQFTMTPDPTQLQPPAATEDTITMLAYSLTADPVRLRHLLKRLGRQYGVRVEWLPGRCEPEPARGIGSGTEASK